MHEVLLIAAAPAGAVKGPALVVFVVPCSSGATGIWLLLPWCWRGAGDIHGALWLADCPRSGLRPWRALGHRCWARGWRRVALWLRPPALVPSAAFLVEIVITISRKAQHHLQRQPAGCCKACRV